mmetsp:Transcript_30417/g.55172  ORF Transcript_30417/g.55172 Transcript_30417/m.55172 type:complete len:209 (-) Transcript_30417:429-1055(-)
MSFIRNKLERWDNFVAIRFSNNIPILTKFQSIHFTSGMHCPARRIGHLWHFGIYHHVFCETILPESSTILFWTNDPEKYSHVQLLLFIIGELKRIRLTIKQIIVWIQSIRLIPLPHQRAGIKLFDCSIVAYILGTVVNVLGYLDTFILFYRAAQPIVQIFRTKFGKATSGTGLFALASTQTRNALDTTRIREQIFRLISAFVDETPHV